jgi:hypothetical protein
MVEHLIKQQVPWCRRSVSCCWHISLIRSPSLPRPIGLIAHNGHRFLIVCRYVQDQRRTKLTTRMWAARRHYSHYRLQARFVSWTCDNTNWVHHRDHKSRQSLSKFESPLSPVALLSTSPPLSKSKKRKCHFRLPVSPLVMWNIDIVMNLSPTELRFSSYCQKEWSLFYPTTLRHYSAARMAGRLSGLHIMRQTSRREVTTNSSPIKK